MLPNIERSTDGKEETWMCTRDMMENRLFPSLFHPKGDIATEIGKLFQDERELPLPQGLSEAKHLSQTG